MGRLPKAKKNKSSPRSRSQAASTLWRLHRHGSAVALPLPSKRAVGDQISPVDGQFWFHLYVSLPVGSIITLIFDHLVTNALSPWSAAPLSFGLPTSRKTVSPSPALTLGRCLQRWGAGATAAGGRV